MALLRTIEIGHPNDGPMARHHLSDHRGGTTVAHDVYHHLIVLEYPVPVGASVDKHRGLIGADDPRAVLQAHGNRCQGDTAAAGTMPGVAFHPCHYRAHHREVDLVVAPVQHL